MSPPDYKIEDYLERFWSKVGSPDKNGCLNWMGKTNWLGYGLIRKSRINGKVKNIAAHRLAWEIKNGKILNGLYCRHHCYNRKCVNVEHLYLGNTDR